MTMDEHATRQHAAATIELVDGILTFTYAAGVYVDETIARSVVAMAGELAGELAPLPTLVIFDRVKGSSKGARDFFAKNPENQAVSSRVALVVNSPIARVVANFFIGLNKTDFPTRLFNDRGAALDWLRS